MTAPSNPRCGGMSGIASQLLDVDLAWVLLLDLGITRFTLLALTCFLFKDSEKDSCVGGGSAVDLSGQRGRNPSSRKVPPTVGTARE